MATVTNPTELMTAKLEGLVTKAGGTLPSRAGVTNAQDYQLDLIDALTTALIASSSAPASASATGTPGQIAYESGQLYVCVATDTWQRVAIATWA